MRDQLQEIRNKIDIAEFIGQFVALKRAGRNFKGNCPFHQEKTPSFVVSPERQIWHCFGACGEGGDVFKFLMKWENISFVEAVRELAQKTGVRLEKITFDDKIAAKRDRLIRLNTLAAEYFNYVLFKNKVGEKGKAYLKSRKINEKLAQKFYLGYAPSSWESLLSFLKKKKYSEAEILEAGLAVRGERGGIYDRFRGRIMFPIKDHRGNIVGFGGRVLEGDGQAKYVNTPESLLYHKRESLYGIDLAKEAIKKEKHIILVEGEFDVLACFSVGIENVCAVKGTAVTREQLSLIKRFAPRLVLVLDADVAGEDAARRAIEEADKLELEVEVVHIDFAKDPDEAIKKDLVSFKKALKNQMPVYDYLIELYKKKYPEDDPYHKKKVADGVIPFIGRITNPIIQSHYIKKIASYLDVSERSVEELIRGVKRKQKQEGYFDLKEKAAETRDMMIQKYLLSLVFQNEKSKDLSAAIFEIVTPEDFTIPAIKKISKSFVEFQKDSVVTQSIQKFISTLDPALAPTFDEIYLYASLDFGFEDEDVKKLAYEVKKQALKKRITSLLSSEDSLTADQKNHIQKLGTRLKEVENKLATM